jgi:hypothetical protein
MTINTKRLLHGFVGFVLLGLGSTAFAKVGTPAQYYRTAIIAPGVQGGNKALKVRTIERWKKQADGKVMGKVEITRLDGSRAIAKVELIGDPTKRRQWEVSPGKGGAAPITVKVPILPMPPKPGKVMTADPDPTRN